MPLNLTIFKCTIQGHLVHSAWRATIAILSLQSIFMTPKGSLCPPPPFSLSCSPCFLSPQICLFWAFHAKGITQYVAFGVWLPLLGIMFSGSSTLIPRRQRFLPFYGWIIFPCTKVPRLSYPFIHEWAFQLFPPLGCSASRHCECSRTSY